MLKMPEQFTNQVQLATKSSYHTAKGRYAAKSAQDVGSALRCFLNAVRKKSCQVACGTEELGCFRSGFIYHHVYVPLHLLCRAMVLSLSYIS